MKDEDGKDEQEIGLEPLSRITKDLREAAKMLTKPELRYLVDFYYQIQANRIRAAAQTRATEEAKEPNRLIAWLGTNQRGLEARIKGALNAATDIPPESVWAKSQAGIGPVIAAGLLAHIDIEKAPTAGHIWRFAGLDPSVRWFGHDAAKVRVKELLGSAEPTHEDVPVLAVKLSMSADRLFVRLDEPVEVPFRRTAPWSKARLVAILAKRPWNANLKTLCWMMGESFVKVSGKDDAFYGKLYARRKAIEVAKNTERLFADQAAASLEAKKYDHSTEAYKAYIDGRLPQARIHLRAERWAVKIFLSHYQQVSYFHRYGTRAPVPFPIAHLGHAHEIDAPDAPWPADRMRGVA